MLAGRKVFGQSVAEWGRPPEKSATAHAAATFTYRGISQEVAVQHIAGKVRFFLETRSANGEEKRMRFGKVGGRRRRVKYRGQNAPLSRSV